jgi:hypothetical protein
VVVYLELLFPNIPTLFPIIQYLEKGQRKTNETLNEPFGFVINSGSIFGTFISNYTDFISKYCIFGKGQ